MSASDKKRLRKEQAAEAMTEKQLKEKNEAKKLKRHTLTFAVVMILVLAIAFGVVAAQGIDRTGIIQRNTNAVTIGSHTLTSAELNYYYIDTVNNTYSQLYNQYGEQTAAYAQLIYGLDFSSPLNTQAYSYTQSWAEYFAETAIESARDVYALYDEAIANGCKFTDDEQKAFDKNLEDIEKYATTLYGYSSMKAYLKDVFGYGATEETYREYMLVNAIANKYYSEYAETLEYSKEDFDKYSNEHFDELSSFTYATFYVDNRDFLGEGQKDSAGIINYTDAQKEAALKTGEKIADTLKNAGISSSALLDQEIKKLEEYKDDDKAVSTKYKDTLYSNVEADIISWLADSSRKAGDFTVIPDTNVTKDEDGNEITNTAGHHIVVFEGRDDNNMRLVNVRHILKKFKGGKTNTDGTVTYSDEEKNQALKDITAVQTKWLEGEKVNEESFTALVKDNSDDSGSASTGGLYEDIYPGQMVTAFNDWCFDTSREAGDYEIVETEYGYHLIYFVGYDEMTYRDYMIENILYTADMDKWYEDIIKSVTPTNINTKHLDLDYVLSAQF